MSSTSAREDAHPAVKGPSALRSILAGSTAGAVEIGQSEPSARGSHKQLLTQSSLQPSHTRPNVRCSANAIPVNCPRRRDSNTSTVAKTRTQLNRRLAEGQKLPWPPFGRQWYAGCTTLIIGNSAKAGIRTLPFPQDPLACEAYREQASSPSTSTSASWPTKTAR
jgi:solute carrier family 25 citrate transporter 1